MKVVIEPSRFRRLLENVLIYHGGAELDSNVGIFTPKKVEFRDISLEVMAVYAAYSPKFFLEYEAGEEQVPLSKSLLEQMRYGFSGDKQMTVRTEGDKIHLEGTRERYEEPLMDVSVGEFPIPIVADKTLGLVPKDLEPQVQVMLKADTLTGLPKAETYLFRCDGEKLEVIVEDVGKYTKELTPSKTQVLEEMEIKFDAGYFAKAANQFGGDVWLTFRPDVAVFSQKLKDSMLTYLLSSV